MLLDLDVNLLKSEIGIMAFGKRMRIANAITDLRRPPSIIYSDQPDQLSPSSMMLTHHASLTPSQSLSHTHSRNQSQSHSHHSYPGTAPTPTYTHSARSSVGNPLVYTNGNGNMNGNGNINGNGYGYPARVSPQNTPQEYGGSEASVAETEQPVGLGIGLPPGAAPSVANGKGMVSVPTLILNKY